MIEGVFKHAKLEVLAGHPRENGPSDCKMEIRTQSLEELMIRRRQWEPVGRSQLVEFKERVLHPKVS